jgi:ketosteroid isomerase-like protein
MRRVNLLALVLAGLCAVTGCTPAANTATNTTVSSNANASAPAAAKPAAPTAAAMLEMDKKAFEAWKNKDAKWFEENTADNFTMQDMDGKIVNKAESIKMIAGHNCVVNSYSLSDEKLTMIGNDTAVLTYKADADSTCGGEKQPTPVTAATAVVRSGDRWKAVWHNEVPIVDPAKMAAGSGTTAAPSADEKDAAAASDPLTSELMSLTKSGWESWKARDANALGNAITDDIVFVDAIGGRHADKSTVLGTWTGQKCDIKSVSVGRGHAVKLGTDSAMLIYKGTADGTCDGQKLGSLWVTAFFERAGNAWKLNYMFETAA